MEDELLKYSQQIIAYVSDSEYYIANGFFVYYRGSYYFVTAEHAISHEDNLLSDVNFVLHENGEGLHTYVKKLETWEVIRIYSNPCENNIFTIPQLKKIEDFVFCEIDKKEPTIKLPFILSGTTFSLCKKKSFKYILLEDNWGKASSEKLYYLAGKKLEEINVVTKSYKSYFYSNMLYLGVFEGLYQFKLDTSPTLEEMKGLSGSPIFDDDKKFVGMVIRYLEDENIIFVFPAEEILFYINNYHYNSFE